MWQLIYENSPWPEKPKLSRNLVSAVHSFLSVALLTTRHPIRYEIIVLNSVSYFIWDLIYMFRYRMEPMFVYHHLVTIWMFLSDLEKSLICEAFFYAELSNMFTYPIYHLMQNKIECKKLKFFQSIWFSYFRIYKFSQFFKYFEYSFLFYNLFVMYIFGIYWSCLQVKKLII